MSRLAVSFFQFHKPEILQIGPSGIISAMYSFVISMYCSQYLLSSGYILKKKCSRNGFLSLHLSTKSHQAKAQLLAGFPTEALYFENNKQHTVEKHMLLFQKKSFNIWV